MTPIATYLGWTRRLPHAKDISIRHLLIHGGGVIRDGSNVWGDDDFPDRETVRADVRQQLTFAEPSTTFRYSNIAYVLLGDALESVTGRSFEALLQRNVLGPLSLKGSAPSLTPRVRKTIATGYYRRRPGRGPAPGASGRGARLCPRRWARRHGPGPAHLSARSFPGSGKPHLRPVTSRDAAHAMAATRGAESRNWLDDLARRRDRHPWPQRWVPRVHDQDRILAGVGPVCGGAQQHQQPGAGPRGRHDLSQRRRGWCVAGETPAKRHTGIRAPASVDSRVTTAVISARSRSCASTGRSTSSILR